MYLSPMPLPPVPPGQPDDGPGREREHVIGSRRACTETTEIRPGYGAARENHSVLLNQDIHLKIENRRELHVAVG